MPSPYITFSDTAPHSLWPLFPEPSFVVFAPPAAPEPRRPADAQAALLAAGDYLGASVEALDAGDVDTLLHNLCVLASIAGVIADRFGRSSSEYAGNAGTLQ